MGTVPAVQLPCFRQVWSRSCGFEAEAAAAAISSMLVSGFTC
jgi:hypothetical protein